MPVTEQSPQTSTTGSSVRFAGGLGFNPILVEDDTHWWLRFWGVAPLPRSRTSNTNLSSRWHRGTLHSRFEQPNSLLHFSARNEAVVWLIKDSRCFVLFRFWSFVLYYVHVRYLLSPIVCCLSVCNVRAPYSGGWNFRPYFYGVRYLGHLLTSTENFTEIVPGEPLCQGS